MTLQTSPPPVERRARTLPWTARPRPLVSGASAVVALLAVVRRRTPPVAPPTTAGTTARVSPPGRGRRRSASTTVAAPLVWGMARYLGGDPSAGLEPMKSYALSFGPKGLRVWELDPTSMTPGTPAGAIEAWRTGWSDVTRCQASGRGDGSPTVSVQAAASTREALEGHLLVETAQGEHHWRFIGESPDQLYRWLAPWRATRRRSALAASSAGSPRPLTHGSAVRATSAAPGVPVR